MADPKVRFKRSSVPGKIPNETQVPLGEIALNTYDGKVFASRNVGLGTTVFVVNPWSVGAGTDVYDTYFTVGNVGIGTTLPSEKLSIVGVVSATGGFNLGISSAGTSITSGPVTTLNFIGAGNTFAVNGSVVDISIAGGGGGSVSISTTPPSSPSDGDLWYSPIYGRTFIYYTDDDSSQWVDAAPFNVTDEAQLTPGKTTTSFVATASQTTFNVDYQIGYVEVYLNGIRLSSSEYTATNGTQIILTEGASENDVVDVVEFIVGTGAEGPQGIPGPLEGITSTVDSSTYYPLIVSGIGSTIPSITTTTNYFSFTPSTGTLNTNELVVSGTGNTALLVQGDARIVGILTIGSSSITLDGINNEIFVGSGVKIYGNSGIVSATSFIGDGSGLTGAGSTVIDDVSTDETLYPILTSQTSGTITSSKVSTTKLSYNPSTGVISGTAFSGSGASLASRFVSTIATGTAPISVSSTTLVTNLNADLLDGLDSSQFLRDDVDATTTGQIQITKANSTTTGGGQLYLNGATGNRIDFNANGVAAPAFTTRSAGTKVVLYPSISASAADYALGIENSTLWYSVPVSTNTHRWYGGTTSMMTLSSSNLTVTGNVTAYSDLNLKENVETIENALDKVTKLRGVEFDRKDLDGNPHQIGVIAQEIEKIIPEVVITNEEGIKSVSYGNLVGLLIEAIKEQQKQIDELKNK